MSVSVAMATYNGARFLEEQLESIAAQTLQPSELVAYDDGSTDGTLSVLSDFSRTSTFPVQIQRGERRRGFADAFLTAAGSCTGALIAFSDQDDVWLPTKLERCRAAFADADVLVAIHSSSVVDEGLVSTGRRYPDVTAERVAPPLTADPWLAVRGMSMVFDARVVRLAAGRPRPPSHYLERTPMHHDEWLYAVASALGAVAFLAEPLALYRQHTGNITGAPPGFAARMHEALTTGARYYGRRREQARELERLFTEFDASTTEDRELAQRAAEAAAWFKNLSDRLDRRLEVYEPGIPVGARVRRLARLARRGGYARGSGFGPAALARDALMIALGRRG